LCTRKKECMYAKYIQWYAVKIKIGNLLPNKQNTDNIDWMSCHQEVFKKGSDDTL
jgi:hypothetical protein